MNGLDILLLVLLLAYAVSGYWQGFITGAFATAGLLLGGLVGIWLAPLLLGDAAPSMWVSLGALFVVLVMASLGQAGRFGSAVQAVGLRGEIDFISTAAVVVGATAADREAQGRSLQGTRLVAGDLQALDMRREVGRITADDLHRICHPPRLRRRRHLHGGQVRLRPLRHSLRRGAGGR